MKTLYVSDLDGTLLRNDQTLSQYTIDTIKKVIESGDYFSYATARSYHTSSKVTEGLDFSIPVIIYNGTMIIDNADGSMIKDAVYDEEGIGLLEDMMAHDVYPIVYAHIDGKERFTYLPYKCTRGMKAFLNTRKDEREIIGTSVSDLYKGQLFHYTCIDEKEKLELLYTKYKDRFPCVFYLDMYTKEYWLEIMPKGVSKANAISELKEMLGCDRVVVFGDNYNDLPMFKMADEAYAVENAVEEVKKAATAVIGSNEEDGVARHLAARHE